MFSTFDDAAQQLDNIDPDVNISDSEQAALINNYIAAREKLDTTVSQIVAIVTIIPGPRHRRVDRRHSRSLCRESRRSSSCRVR